MTFRQVIREAAEQADLTTADRVRLRMVMRFRPTRLEQEILNQAQVEGIVPASLTLAAINSADATAQIDWAALAEFIKEVLPAILQIISLFL